MLSAVEATLTVAAASAALTIKAAVAAVVATLATVPATPTAVLTALPTLAADDSRLLGGCGASGRAGELLGVLGDGCVSATALRAELGRMFSAAVCSGICVCALGTRSSTSATDCSPAADAPAALAVLAAVDAADVVVDATAVVALCRVRARAAWLAASRASSSGVCGIKSSSVDSASSSLSVSPASQTSFWPRLPS